LHYMEAMEEVRLEDWEVQYAGNRFAWLGNGYSRTEIDPTADWAYYIREQDDGAPLSRTRRTEVINKSGTIAYRDSVSFTGFKAEEPKL